MEVNRKSILSVIVRRFKLDNTDIDRRLELQKTIYLMQAAGIDLGYGFNWYKHGPYSQELADESYDVLTAHREDYKETDSWGFNDATETELKEFEEAWRPIKERNGQLELVSSVDFMKVIWGENFKDENDWCDKLKTRKSALHDEDDYNKEDVKVALNSQKQIRK